MESQPQNPEFRYNPENFYPCLCNTVQTHVPAFKRIKVCYGHGMQSEVGYL